MHVSDQVTIGFDFILARVHRHRHRVARLLLVVLMLGVQNGIGKLNVVLIPLLVVMFLIMVGMALTLPGAGAGHRRAVHAVVGALGDSSVWVAAYGQIFFSLSVGFGIMVTYASYLKPRSDLSGSALVVGFANSSFEILAGIGGVRRTGLRWRTRPARPSRTSRPPGSGSRSSRSRRSSPRRRSAP